MNKKMRWGGMAAAIALGVGAFLGAQRLDLIPGPWSNAGGVPTGSGPRSMAGLTAAITADPTDYMTHYRRGTAFQRQRRYEQALADLNEAIKLSPTPLSLEALGMRAADSSAPETHTLSLVF